MPSTSSAPPSSPESPAPPSSGWPVSSCSEGSWDISIPLGKKEALGAGPGPALHCEVSWETPVGHGPLSPQLQNYPREGPAQCQGHRQRGPVGHRWPLLG